MTATTLPTPAARREPRARRIARRPRAALRRRQLPPAAGDAGARRRRLAVRQRRPPPPRHDVGVLRGQLRPRPSGPRARSQRAGRAPRGDQPRLPHRPPRSVPARRLRDDRHGQGAADEHRRRGRRDGGQGGAQVGLQGQARAGRTRRDHRRRRQLRRPDDDHRRLLERSAVPRRLRAVRAGLRQRAVRRCRRARGGDHAEHRGVPGRADPGRGRHHRSARRLPGARARDLHAPRHPADLRRGADRPRPHRRACSRATTTASAPTASSSARRSAAACCR